MKASRKPSQGVKGTGDGAGLLDATALEAVDRFVRVLAACGCAPGEISTAFVNACERLPKARAGVARRVDRELSDASHVLTVWFTDPEYLDDQGKPLRLLPHGPGPSLEALVNRVDPALDVDEVLRYLRRTNALLRFGKRYAPRMRALSLRGAQGPERFRNLRGLLGMLRTLEHNMQPKSRVRSWFEYFAENPAVPVRSVGAFDTRLDRQAMKQLQLADADLHRLELKGRPGEPVVRIGVGVYRWQEEVPQRTRTRSRATKPTQRNGKKERRSV